MMRGLLVGLVLALTVNVARAQQPGAAARPPLEMPLEPGDALPARAASDTPPNPEPVATSPVTELTAVPDAAADAALASDLASLGLDLNGSGVDLGFHFSGFADFTSVFPVDPRGAPTVGLPTKQSFYIGNVNVYLSKNLSENFRMMGEVRLTYLPNGALVPTAGSINYVNTAVGDYADLNRPERWGGIVLQRLYLEWTLHPMITVRGGQFLTPYGIWNVDHGSPAYIPVQRPYAVNSDFFPQRQTGIEVLGRWNATNENTFGYHLTVSNGGGPVSEYRDFDKNKALGARLYWENQGGGFFRLGASGYYGMDTTSTPTVTFDTSKLAVGENLSTQFYALALAADVSYTYRGFHFQAEWVSQQRKYTDDGRTAHDEYFAPVSRAFSSNFFNWAAYGLIAYSLPWYALTPYAMLQHTRSVLNTNFPDYIIDALLVAGGLNIHPIDAVVFKAEYSRAMFHNGGPVLAYPITLVQLQAAWAF